jgi:hypothetical protein
MRSGLIWNEEHIPEESCAKIREILMERWDPIGISDEPQAADEYDSYIPKIHHLLNSNASIAEIQDYLFEIVDKRMGMSPPATLEHMKLAAEALKELRLTV